MRVLISGIGRSGTTMMYHQIGLMMQDAFEAPRYRYEPYLWNLNAPNTKLASYGPENLSSKGMQVHQAAPLFLDGFHPVHEAFLWSLYGGAQSLPGDPEFPDAWLAKIIRGSGRLESYLQAFPDLKIVICLRNPLDTLNSSLGMFSFTGEEFHVSDAPRLFAEVAERLPHLALPDLKTASHLEISAVWWRAFTEWSVRVAEKYPDRCFVFRHELMAELEDALVDKLTGFLGFSSSRVFKMGLRETAGRKTTATHLLAADIAQMQPYLAYYFDQCLAADMSTEERQRLEARLIQRYAGGEFSPQLAADRLGRRSTLGLREDILGGHDVARKYVAPKSADPARIPLRVHVEAHVAQKSVAIGAYKAIATPALIRTARQTFGCCIASHNNRDTIRDAIFSALDQTRPFDRIVVVDDASRDGTQAILKDLERRYSSLDIQYRQHNGGVSATRQQAIHALGTDFITQLDGDDCFWPTKNREEAEIVIDDPSAVAFSRYLMDIDPNSQQIVDTSDFAGDPGHVFNKLIARTPGIPRDMTMSAETFSAAGGYDARLNLFEDWDFKMRLAKVSGPWRMSGSHLGTVYNRRRPGLSQVGNAAHRRAITYAFLKTMLRYPEQGRLAECYALATRSLEDPVTAAMYSYLLACDAGAAQLEDLRPLTGRDWAAKSQEDFGLSVKALDNARRGGEASVMWLPMEGFGNNQAPYADIPRSEFYWQLENMARVAVDVSQPVGGLSIEFYSPARDNEVTVDLFNGSTLLSKTIAIEKSGRSGEVLQPVTVSLDTPLQPGYYDVKLTTKYFTAKPSHTSGVPDRNLFVIVSGVAPTVQPLA